MDLNDKIKTIALKLCAHLNKMIYYGRVGPFMVVAISCTLRVFVNRDTYVVWSSKKIVYKGNSDNEVIRVVKDEDKANEIRKFIGEKEFRKACVIQVPDKKEQVSTQLTTTPNITWDVVQSNLNINRSYQ
jgi:hypothetical protein